MIDNGSPHPPLLHGKSRESGDIIEYERDDVFDQSKSTRVLTRPAPHVDSQVSIDHCRRSQLANILRKRDCQQYVSVPPRPWSGLRDSLSIPQLIDEWMLLIKEKSKTELLSVVSHRQSLFAPHALFLAYFPGEFDRALDEHLWLSRSSEYGFTSRCSQ